MGLTDIKQLLPTDVYNALINASSPSAANPYLTTSAVAAGYVPYTGAIANVDLGAFSLTSPLVIGGTSVGSTLTLKGTSGNGTSTVSAINFLVGNNGATQVGYFFNNGTINFGNSATINATAVGAVRIASGTSWADIGTFNGVGATAIWLRGGTPTTSNYTLYDSGAGSTLLHGGTTVSIVVNNNTQTTFAQTLVTFQTAATGVGSTTPFLFTVPASTAQTTTVEVPGLIYNNTGTTRQWTTGNILNQREIWLKTTTYGFVGASIITNAYGLYISSPTAGSFATITNNFGLGVAGNVNIVGGGLRFSDKGIDTTAGDSATINSTIGRFRKDTTGTTFTLTNSYITANSIIQLTCSSSGGDEPRVLSVVAGAGSAVITFWITILGVMTANSPGANLDVDFTIFN